jgi:two-component sensor histidine kinase
VGAQPDSTAETNALTKVSSRYRATPRKRRTWSIVKLLGLFTLAMAIPYAAVVTFDVFRLVSFETSTLRRAVQGAADKIAAEVDRRITGYKSVLETLASSPALQAGDLASFYTQARAALEPKGLSLVLRDRAHEHLLDTAVSFRGELRTESSPTEFPGSSVLIGVATKTPLIEISVPVLRNGDSYGDLAFLLHPSHFRAVIDPHKLPRKWRAGVVDHDGASIAGLRFSLEKSRNVLVDDRRFIAGYSKPALADWWVAVLAPPPLVNIRNAILVRHAPFTLTFAVLGMLGCWILGRLISRPIVAVAQAAKALGAGEHVAFEPSSVRETNSVGLALQVAADERIATESSLRKSEKRLQFSLVELGHRIKNLLYVVQEMGCQLAHTARSPSEFEERFTDRVAALGRSQSLLLERTTQDAAFADLVSAHVTPFLDDAARRLEATGPELIVKRGAAQDLGIVLHELATNAARHGALKTAEGRIIVRWELHSETGQFHMSWTEAGGPAVVPPQHKGFGLMMVTDMIEHYGKVNLAFNPDGVAWEFTAPARILFR